jgi:hypothetical protein
VVEDVSDGGLQWWRLAFVAALILVLALSGLLWLRHQEAAPLPARSCAPPAPISELKLPALQYETPVLLASSAEVVLSVDGAPAPADGVARLSPGKHTLRATAAGSAPLSLDFRLDAFDPALFEVELSGKHLSLVYLGAPCLSCSTVGNQQLLPQVPASAPFDELEAHAADALLTQDWMKAAQFLKQVQPHERELTRFKRLAQNVLQSSGAHAEARAQLLGITGSAALDGLLSRYDELTGSESDREHLQWLTRWNALTEIYQRLLRLEDDAPQILDASSARLAQASGDFTRASKERSAEGERDAVELGEKVMLELVQQLRAFHPTDCELQAKVSAAL